MTEMNASPAVDPTIPTHEGRASFDVGEETLQTWYRVFGDLASGTKPPLVVLHGGPGEYHHDVVLVKWD
jgi:poly(3-hydroxybutyrate) depolymerase